MAKNKEFSSWEDLVAGVNNALKSVLKKEVQPEVKKIVDKHIQSDIYDTYSPVGREHGGYDRRGALGNSSNTKGYIESDGDGYTLRVTNEAPPSPSVFQSGSGGGQADRLLYWIENGCVPNYFNTSKHYAWESPRPAIENAQAEIDGGALDAVIQNAINKEIG